MKPLDRYNREAQSKTEIIMSDFAFKMNQDEILRERADKSGQGEYTALVIEVT